MIQAEHIKYEYFRRDESGNVTEIVEAVKDVSLHIKQGEFVAILGKNGSGKSTFAKLMNAILTLSEGSLVIAGYDAREESNTWKIRKKTGMVFQNPDNQIVGTVVEEDVAFGPENIGVPENEMLIRVAESLEQVGMTAYRMSQPQHLSGGQKQRVAIAGVLAMHPKCIIFDEATAMLDPRGRTEVLSIARKLCDEQNITVLYITHEMEEAIAADRVCVLYEGALVMEGEPRKLFDHIDELSRYGLYVPKITEIAAFLKARGIAFPSGILDIEDFVSGMNHVMAYKAANTIQQPIQRRGNEEQQFINNNIVPSAADPEEDVREAMTNGLVCDNISFDYSPNTVYSKQVLSSVSLAIPKGEMIALIGKTGSGKSTLVQQLNGLLKPTEGQIYYEGKDIYEKGYDRSYLRSKVGLVFQYPEYQLFAETVLEDVSYGPKNLKLPLLDVQKRAFDAIRKVGLGDDIYDTSPFALSGGQMRRVAIAGVLAMQPDILILDEPSAGLDPAGRRELFQLLTRLHEQGMTILFITHNMEEAAEYAERILVMDDGHLVYDGRTEEIFTHYDELHSLGLDIPVVTRLMQELHRNGYPVPTNIYRTRDAIRSLLSRIESL